MDNNEFSLQLNNKYAEMQDLGRFFFECIIPNPEVIKFPKSALYIEKMTPMKFVEDIFYNLKIVNQPKVSLINNINLNYNDSIGLYYEYELLNKKLPPIYENDNYSTNTSKTPGLPPPPPPPYSPIFGSQNLKSKFILLKQDNIYFNDKIISTTQLKSIVKPWIKNNNVIFSLYDLESTYGKFLEMNAVINSVYQEVRGSQSKLMYNKTLKELNRKEDNEIKSQNPMRHIWSYSIPHYNYVIEQENSFFGLKVNKKM